MHLLRAILAALWLHAEGGPPHIDPLFAGIFVSAMSSLRWLICSSPSVSARVKEEKRFRGEHITGFY